MTNPARRKVGGIVLGGMEYFAYRAKYFVIAKKNFIFA
jgi:hypothetical protein